SQRVTSAPRPANSSIRVLWLTPAPMKATFLPRTSAASCCCSFCITKTSPGAWRPKLPVDSDTRSIIALLAAVGNENPKTERKSLLFFRGLSATLDLFRLPARLHKAARHGSFSDDISINHAIQDPGAAARCAGHDRKELHLETFSCSADGGRTGSRPAAAPGGLHPGVRRQQLHL